MVKSILNDEEIKNELTHLKMIKQKMKDANDELKKQRKEYIKSRNTLADLYIQKKYQEEDEYLDLEEELEIEDLEDD